MLLMVAASPVQALVEDLNPNYAVSVDPVSRFTVPAGKWYVLYNVGRKVYLYENGAPISSALLMPARASITSKPQRANISKTS